MWYFMVALVFDLLYLIGDNIIRYMVNICAFDIKTFQMMEGDLPVKAQGLVQEWAKQHQDALLRIWNTQKFIKLPPLE